MAMLYNSLPTVEDANAALADKGALFERLAPLLAAYDFDYGAVLVHAHTALAADEIMVDDGTRTSPVTMGTEPVYGERWLSSGEAYEFTRSPVPPPPIELLKAFREIVGDYPLGIFYAKDVLQTHKGKAGLERTIGRENVIEWVDIETLEHDSGRYLETAWVPGTKDPVGLYCFVRCLVGMTTGKHLGHTVHE